MQSSGERQKQWRQNEVRETRFLFWWKELTADSLWKVLYWVEKPLLLGLAEVPLEAHTVILDSLDARKDGHLQALEVQVTFWGWTRTNDTHVFFLPHVYSRSWDQNCPEELAAWDTGPLTLLSNSVSPTSWLLAWRGISPVSTALWRSW